MLSQHLIRRLPPRDSPAGLLPPPLCLSEEEAAHADLYFSFSLFSQKRAFKRVIDVYPSPSSPSRQEESAGGRADFPPLPRYGDIRSFCFSPFFLG